MGHLPKIVPREVVYSPLFYRGLELHDLFTEQGIAHTNFILHQFRKPSDVSDTLKILLEAFQLNSGLYRDALTNTEPVNYVDAPWVNTTRSFLYNNNAEIKIPCLTKIKPQQENDKLIRRCYETPKTNINNFF